MAEYIVEEPSDRSASWQVHERIVRCRDCKYCREHNMRAYGGGRDQLLCHHFSMSSDAGWPVESNGFCAWGERRED